jgi:hypothetical protein
MMYVEHVFGINGCRLWQRLWSKLLGFAAGTEEDGN